MLSVVVESSTISIVLEALLWQPIISGLLAGGDTMMSSQW